MCNDYIYDGPSVRRIYARALFREINPCNIETIVVITDDVFYQVNNAVRDITGEDVEILSTDGKMRKIKIPCCV